MTEQETEQVTHEQVEQHLQEEMDWPQYYACGEEVGDDDFVPAYYRVEAPNGPVSYVNPNTGPYPTTMHSLAQEAQMDDFRPVLREETPWEEIENDENR